MNMSTAWRISIYGCVLLVTSIAATHAQKGQRDSDGELLTFFYKDPRPERLAGFVERYQAGPNGDRLQSYVPLAGFYAVLCKAQPQQFEKLVPLDLKPRMAVTIAVAIKMCGDTAITEKLKSRIAPLATDQQLNAAFASLPNNLDDLRVKNPLHLDLLWGASFASGDERHVAPIMAYLSQTADKSATIAVDLGKVVIEMVGGPKEIISQLREKYGEDQARQMIFAASALWALRSNAQQHVFVERYVTRYIAENRDTPTAKVLSALLSKDKRT